LLSAPSKAGKIYDRDSSAIGGQKLFFLLLLRQSVSHINHAPALAFAINEMQRVERRAAKARKATSIAHEMGCRRAPCARCWPLPVNFRPTPTSHRASRATNFSCLHCRRLRPLPSLRCALDSRYRKSFSALDSQSLLFMDHRAFRRSV
jgi:hypothetical protein